MRATTRLLQSCRVTFFTRENCGLCTNARQVLADVWEKRPFAFSEIDIVKPEHKSWKDKYDFDVPVVSFILSQGAELSLKAADTHQQSKCP